MSKIKNGRELVLRADSHAKFDRIKQGTYGNASVNGHATFKGCAIGCLSTPHRKRDLFAFLRKRRDEGEDLRDFDREPQVAALNREFGICEALTDLSEAIFEDFNKHGAAIEFIPRYARAVAACEGKRITDRQVREFRNRTTSSSTGAVLSFIDDPEEASKELFAWLAKRAV